MGINCANSSVTVNTSNGSQSSSLPKAPAPVNNTTQRTNRDPSNPGDILNKAMSLTNPGQSGGLANTGALQNFGFGTMPPADSPDITDTLVRQRRAAAAYQALSGRGRASTMLTSAAGPSVGGAGLGKTLLGGG